MAVRYLNKKRKKVVTFAQPQPRLERNKNFERVDDDKPAAKKSTAKKSDDKS